MILTLDVETWGSNYFAFGIIYDPIQETHKLFYSEKSMRNYLISLADKRKRAEKIEIWGHNIAYDLNWIFDNFEMFFKNEWNVEIDGQNKKHRRFYKKNIYRGGRLYEAKFHNLIFRDTFNLFPKSLADAGKVVGHAKKIDLRKKFETAKEPGIITEEDINYCLDDCIITYKILKQIEKWVEDHGGKLKRTIASTALTILRNYNPQFKNWAQDMNKGYKKINGKVEVSGLAELDEKFRASYFGGRTETHAKSGYNLFYYDINSLYPYVMSDSKYHYPDPSTLFIFHGKIETALKQYEGMAHIKIQVPKNLKIPVLPYRVQKIEGVSNGKIIYPTGKFWGKWCFPEIRLALKMGCKILEVKEIICGHKMSSPFRDYVIDLYNERLAKKALDDPTEELEKLYMNTSYGKFGESDFENRIITMAEMDLIIEEKENALLEALESGVIDQAEFEYQKSLLIYDIVIYKGQEYVKYKTNPQRSRTTILALASYVTSHARCTTYDWYEKADFDVYYSDTDSIITSKILPTGINLGEMKIEAEIIFASFKGRKDYYLNCSKIYKGSKILENKGIVKRKGCSLKFVTELEVNGQKIEVDEKILNGLQNNDPEITRWYHESKVLTINRILKSREAIIRDLKASSMQEGDKERIAEFDDGRQWNNDLSIPYYINQENEYDIPVLA